MKTTAHSAFTLLELLVTSSITAILMLAISSLFITFLATAYKSRISQNLRESGGNAMRQITDMIRNANEITSTCEADLPLTSLSLISPDGLESTIIETNDRIASVSANNTFYLTESVIAADYVRNFTLRCYPTEEGKKYVQVNFNLRVGEGDASNSARSTSLDFGGGVVTRN